MEVQTFCATWYWMAEGGDVVTLNYRGHINGGGPDLKGGTSHPSSYDAFNVASYNWIVSFESCTCLLLFPRGKDASGWQEAKRYNRHIQNADPKKDVLQDFLFSFIYGIWFIYMVYITFYNKWP